MDGAGERMKAGKPHRVPLSSRALHPRRNGVRSDRTTSSFRAGSQVGPYRIRHYLYCCGGCDMRTLLATVSIELSGLGGRVTSFPREVAEMALAHAVPDAVEAAYRRGDLLEKRRKLMDAWASYCARAAVGR